MLSVLPPCREEDRGAPGFVEEGFVSSAAVAVVAVASVESVESDRSVDGRGVRFWFVGMRLDCARG